MDLEKSGAHRAEMQVSILTYTLAQTKIRAQLISFPLKGSMNKWAKILTCAMGTTRKVGAPDTSAFRTLADTDI